MPHRLRAPSPAAAPRRPLGGRLATWALWLGLALVAGAWMAATGAIHPVASDPRFAQYGQATAYAVEPPPLPVADAGSLPRYSPSLQTGNPLDPQFWMNVFSNAATWLVKGFTAGMALVVNSFTAPLQLFGSAGLSMVFRTPEELTVGWGGDSAFGSPRAAAEVIASASTAILVLILSWRLKQLMTNYSRYALTQLLISGIGGLALIWGMWEVCTIMIRFANVLCDAMVATMFGSGLPIIPYPDPGIFGGLSLVLALVLFFYWLMICLMTVHAFRRIVLVNLLLIVSPLVGLAFATNRGWNYGRVWFFRFIELLVTPIIWAAALGYGRTLVAAWTTRANPADQIVAACIGAILAAFVYALTINAPYHVRLASAYMVSHGRLFGLLGALGIASAARRQQPQQPQSPAPVPTTRFGPGTPTQRLPAAPVTTRLPPGAPTTVRLPRPQGTTGPTVRLGTPNATTGQTVPLRGGAATGQTVQLNMEASPTTGATVPLASHASVGGTAQLAASPGAYDGDTMQLAPSPQANTGKTVDLSQHPYAVAAGSTGIGIHSTPTQRVGPGGSYSLNQAPVRSLAAAAGGTPAGGSQPQPVQQPAQVAQAAQAQAQAAQAQAQAAQAQQRAARRAAAAGAPSTPSAPARPIPVSGATSPSAAASAGGASQTPATGGASGATPTPASGATATTTAQPARVAPGTVARQQRVSARQARYQDPQVRARAAQQALDINARKARRQGVYRPQTAAAVAQPTAARIRPVQDRVVNGVTQPAGGMRTYGGGSGGAAAAAPEWQLTPRSDTRVAVIASASDYDRLTALYPSPQDATRLSFEALSQDYDAVHLTESGARLPELQQAGPAGTIWMRWSFDEPGGRPTGVVHGHQVHTPIGSPAAPPTPRAVVAPLAGAARDRAVRHAQKAGARQGRAAGIYGPQSGAGAPPAVPRGDVLQDDTQRRQANRPLGVETINNLGPAAASAQWTVTPRADARVAVVDDERDYEQLRRLYPNPNDPDFLSFEAMARDFDAFHVTPNGLEVLEAATHMGTQSGTVWFRWAFEEAAPVPAGGGQNFSAFAGPTWISPRVAGSPLLIHAADGPAEMQAAWEAASADVVEEMRAWREQVAAGEVDDSSLEGDAALYRDQVEETYDPIYDDPARFERALADERARVLDELEDWRRQHQGARPDQIEVVMDSRLGDLRERVIRGMLGYQLAADLTGDIPTPVAVCRGCGQPRGARGASHRARTAQADVDGHPSPESNPATPCPYCGG